MDYHGKNIPIADHPLGKIVRSQWDTELEKRGYTKDMNVYDLPDDVYFEICTIIDSVVEPWFEGQVYETQRNHMNAWNYQARHKTKYRYGVQKEK